MDRLCLIACTLLFSFSSLCSDDEFNSDYDFEIAEKIPVYSLSDEEKYEYDPSLEESPEYFCKIIVIAKNQEI